MKETIISGRNVCKSFANNGGQNHVLDMVNVDIYEGDLTVIMGSSGAGKSTLLYVLSGMDSLTAGTVEYKGNSIAEYKERQMAQLRAMEFGFVFQQTHLVSNLTLAENVAAPGYLNKSRSTKETRARATELLRKMHVEHAADRLPSQVSGGEAQRAAVARALINEPALIFADEPTGALNRHNTEEVLDIFVNMHREGQSILMVTHDIHAAVRATRLLYLDDGKIIGEMSMPPYEASGAKSREAQVNAWLSSMDW